MAGRSGSFAAPAGFRDSPTRALGQGEVVASTYQIRDEIARANDGVVFEARDMLLDRLVAIKLAWRDAGTPSLVPEARRCAAVRDACGVQVHGVGTHHGAEFVVAERVLGQLLRDQLTSPLSSEVYLSRLRMLVAAVARAHEAGIAVGEISGSTVLVVAEPAIAAPYSAAGPDGGMPPSTTARLVLGRLSLSQVPAFGPHGQIVAPEVVRGEVAGDDPQAAEAIDLYGLGCAAIELACGAPPFVADDPAVELRSHATDRPPRLADLRPDLPSELSELVDWLLAKQPVLRPRSVRDVLAQIDAVIERLGTGHRALRVLIVDDDTARARWLWSVVRRALGAAHVETASEGTDAAHKLNRDQPDLVFVDAALRGVMNSLELCMYARGLDVSHRSQLYLIGAVSERDRALLADADAGVIAEDSELANAILDRVRAAAAARPRTRKPRTTVSG